MGSFLDRMLGKQTGSAHDAKDRLGLVLIHDRMDITPATLTALKDELLEVISRYVEIDAASVKISMENEGREQRLTADIPLKNPRRKRIG